MPTNDAEYTNGANRDPFSGGAEGGPVPAPPAEELPDWTREFSLEDVRRLYVRNGYERFEALFADCDAAGGMRPSLVVAPFFISHLWFFYRKMYLEGLILMGLAVLLMAVCLKITAVNVTAGIRVSLGLNLAFLLGMMIYGKALYWKAVDRKIARAMRLFPDSPQRALTWLSRAGGTNPGLVLALLALGLSLIFGLTPDPGALGPAGGQ